jgi:tetratricopeptide (TPR) repeat protein
MGKTFRDKKEERQQNKFIGRTEYIESFITNFESSDSSVFFNIYGQGGVGKSYLVKKMISIADEKNCLTTYTDESVKSLLEWMDKISVQLKTKDVDLADFDKRYKVYLQETKKLETDPEKPKGTLGSFTKSVMKGVIKDVKKIPGAETIASFINEDSVAGIIGEWAEFARKKITNKDEVELVLEPVKVLTPLFWNGINKYVDFKKSICFFIDTFEETDKIIEKWLLDVLHENYGNIVPYNVMFVIAGRNELSPNEWNEFADLTQKILLEPFTDDEAGEYLTSHQILDFEVREDILNLSGRLPVLMSWLVEAAKNKTVNSNDFCANAVERFLKWVDEPDKREIALVCALPRFINQDIVSVFLEDKTKAPVLFDWLLTQPFVQKKGKYWTYHTVVRNQLLRFEHIRSNEDWYKFHQKLKNSYYNWQTSLEIDPNELLSNKNWLYYEQERLYHALCYEPDKNISSTISDVVKVWLEKGLDSSFQWAETLTQAGNDNNHEGCKDWGNRLTISLNDFLVNEKPLALQKLIENIISKGYTKDVKQKSFLFFMQGVLHSKNGDVDKAIEYYLKAVDIRPDYADAFYGMGLAYYDSGDQDKAIGCYQKVVQIRPDDANAFIFIGLVNYDKGDNEKAIECYNKAISILPDYYEAHYNMGLAYYSMGDNEKAIGCYNNAIDIQPDYDAFYNMGLAYYGMGYNEKAMKCYEKAIDIKPDFVSAYINMGIAYSANEDKDSAIECYQRAIDIKPDYANAFYNMGLAHHDKGDKDLAIEWYQKAIDLQPGYFDAFYNIGLAYYDKGSNEKAIECYQKAIDLKPDYSDAFYNMGLAYYNMGDNEKAIECYQKAIDIKPNYSNAFINLGIAYSARGDKDKAIECYQKAIDIRPDYANAFYNMGLAYYDKGDKDQAIECYQKTVNIQPDYANAFYSMGSTYHDKGDRDNAIECYQKVIDIQPDYANAFYGIGLAYYDKGDKDRAIEYFQNVIDIQPGYANAFYSMGLVYHDMGDKDKAIEFYQKAIDIQPDDANAFINIGLAYYDKGDKDRAIEFYQKALDIQPDDTNAFINMGLAYYDKGDKNKAIGFYQKAIDIQPDEANASYSIGYLFLQTGKLERAEEMLQKSIALGKNDYGNMNLGHVYLSKKNETDALDCYHKSLAAFSDKEKFWEGMKEDYPYLEQYGISIDYYDEVLARIA